MHAASADTSAAIDFDLEVIPFRDKAPATRVSVTLSRTIDSAAEIPLKPTMLIESRNYHYCGG